MFFNCSSQYDLFLAHCLKVAIHALFFYIRLRKCDVGVEYLFQQFLKFSTELFLVNTKVRNIFGYFFFLDTYNRRIVIGCSTMYVEQGRRYFLRQCNQWCIRQRFRCFNSRRLICNLKIRECSSCKCNN